MTTQTAAPPLPIPKRSKRRWYFVGAFVLFLIATPFVYLLAVGHWREHELERIYRELDAEDPNWRWADLVKQLPPAPPERNAIAQLIKVSKLVQLAPLGTPLGAKLPLPKNARLKDADEQRLRAGLAALAPTTLEEADKLKNMPMGAFAIDLALGPMEVELEIIRILWVMRVLEHEAMRRGQDGALDEAAETCLALAHSAHAIGDVPQLMGQMVRVAGQCFAVEAIERTLGQGLVEEKTLEALQAALTIEANHDGIFHALRGERVFGHEYYLSLRDGKIPAEKFIRDMKLDLTPKGKLYYLFPSMLLRGYPEALRRKNEFVRAAKLKDEAQIEAFRSLRSAKQDPENPWNFIEWFIFGQIDSLRADQTRSRCAVVAIAAERYRLKYEQWPKGIAELIKEGLLKEPITDPYDGQPLRFHGTDTGLIVYSIGADKIDNQGKKGNIAFELWLPNFRATAPAAELAAPKLKR